VENEETDFIRNAGKLVIVWIGAVYFSPWIVLVKGTGISAE